MSFEPRHSDDKASTGDTSSPPNSKNTLNVALESSMKIWQVTSTLACREMHCYLFMQPSGAGDLFSTRNVLESTPGHLSAALDYSWMDFPKPSSGYKQKEFFSRGKQLLFTISCNQSCKLTTIDVCVCVQVLIEVVCLVSPAVPRTAPLQLPVTTTLDQTVSLVSNNNVSVPRY